MQSQKAQEGTERVAGGETWEGSSCRSLSGVTEKCGSLSTGREGASKIRGHQRGYLKSRFLTGDPAIGNDTVKIVTVELGS